MNAEPTPNHVADAQPVHGLASLVPWDEHQKANENIFPTPESWRWFVRQHRAELVERGALCYVAGRVFVVADVFSRVVVEIGCRMAARRGNAALAEAA